MLNKAQTEYNNNNNKQQQHSQSVANFFRQASHPVQSTVPIQIQNVNSLESIEKHIRASPPNRKLRKYSFQNRSINEFISLFKKIMLIITRKMNQSTLRLPTFSIPTI